MSVKPCPFCGSKDTGAGYDEPMRHYSTREETWYQTTCGECHASGPRVYLTDDLSDDDAEAEAIHAWNRAADALRAVGFRQSPIMPCT